MRPYFWIWREDSAARAYASEYPARAARSRSVIRPSATSNLVTRRHSRRASLFRKEGHEGIAGSGSGSLLFSRRLPGFPRSSFRLVGVGGGPGIFISKTLLHD